MRSEDYVFESSCIDRPPRTKHIENQLVGPCGVLETFSPSAMCFATEGTCELCPAGTRLFAMEAQGTNFSCKECEEYEYSTDDRSDCKADRTMGRVEAAGWFLHGSEGEAQTTVANSRFNCLHPPFLSSTSACIWTRVVWVDVPTKIEPRSITLDSPKTAGCNLPSLQQTWKWENGKAVYL